MMKHVNHKGKRSNW